MSLILIAVAIIVTLVDWFTAKPKQNEPKWPRWAKLLCALIVAGIGFYGLLEGYFAIGKGIDAYKERNLIQAVENLNKAYSSPFKNRKVLDYLGLAHKNIADQAVDGPVAKKEYEKSLSYFLESRIHYQNSPFAKNGMINVYRQLKDWEQLLPLASSFESQLKSGELENDGKPLSKSLTATFLVTLGNIFADQDNPKRSDKHALGLYRHALDLDPDNMFAILNVPPRLIDIAMAMPVSSKERNKLLSDTIALAIKGMKLDEKRDQVFSVLTLIQVMLLEDAPPIPLKEYSLDRALEFIEENEEAKLDFDVDTWFVITEAHLKLGQTAKAKESFNQALIYQARFTNEQHKWASKFWKELVDPGDYPFQQLILKSSESS